MSKQFEIFPQAVTIFPNDRQKFKVRGVPPPPMWQAITSGQVQSDYSLKLNPGTDPFVEGYSAYGLYSGIGYVDFLIQDDSKPTSTGYFQIVGFLLTDSGAFNYVVQVKATQIEIYREGAVLLTTISYSTVSGDRYRLELATGFRLYRNGTFLHERVSLGGDAWYPMGFSAAVVKPVVGSNPTIRRPDLIGDWRLGPYVNFTDPGEGSITSTGPGIETEYYDGIRPGVYTLVAQIASASDPNNLQRATATITIPPLEILGGDSLTLQPGEAVRLSTNYDAAQNSLVAWSVVSGSGSFSAGNKFTAASTPGVTVVRAVADVNDTVALLTITVPAVIAAAIGSMSVTAAQASEAITLTTNMTGTLTWSAGCGAVTPSGTGQTKTWTAPSDTGRTCRVSVTNGTDRAYIDIPVVEKFPYDPSSPIEADDDFAAVISDSEDGTSRSSRVKNKGGQTVRVGEMQFKNRNQTELLAARDFVKRHFPGNRCIIQDSFLGRRWLVWIDSNLRWQVEGDCSITYTFRIKEALM